MIHYMRKILFFSCLLLCATILMAQTGEMLLEQARNAMNRGDTAQARTLLLPIIRDDTQDAGVMAESLYRLSTILLHEQQSHNDAERYLTLIIENYEDSLYYDLALYQLALLPYQRAEYERAIVSLHNYVRTISDSPYISHAYYWLGESLLQLGKMDAARKAFELVIESDTVNLRISDAKKRIDLVELSIRERGLRKLLFASHEENLLLTSQINDLKRTNEELAQTYSERINTADNIAVSTQKTEQEKEIIRLRAEVEALNKQLKTIIDAASQKN